MTRVVDPHHFSLQILIRIRIQPFPFMRIHIRIWIQDYFESLKLLNSDFDAGPDPDPASKLMRIHADPDPASKVNADLDPHCNLDNKQKYYPRKRPSASKFHGAVSAVSKLLLRSVVKVSSCRREQK